MSSSDQTGEDRKRDFLAHAEYDGEVLSTMNADGSRKKMRPKLFKGRYHRARLLVGWGLIALFVSLPIVHINGRPAVLLDLATRRFSLFGATFLPSDTFILLLFLLGTFVTVFLLTALFGRVWCGWGCPQTVYLEFVYRPIERWIEGGRTGSIKMDRRGMTWRRVAKHGIYLVISVALANVFLSYFVGWERLGEWMTSSPSKNPGGFGVVAVTSALMMIDFGFFREQMCTLACPYARLQSVLLDKKSLIVGYDAKRGEPRGKRKKFETATNLGDCIDCKACVVTCPTGIDIRNGLQLECVACTQCIDACDSIMDKVGKPRGLIRYTSQDALEGKPLRILRPRVLVYPVIIVAAFAALVFAMPSGGDAHIAILRGIGAPFSVTPDGGVTNQVRVKVTNRTDEERSYLVEIVGLEDFELVAPVNPFTVQGNRVDEQTVFVTMQPRGWRGDKLHYTVRVTDDLGNENDLPFTFLGPTQNATPAAGKAPEDATTGGDES